MSTRGGDDFMAEPDEPRRAGRIPRSGTGTMARPRREPAPRPRPEPRPRDPQERAAGDLMPDQPQAPRRTARPGARQDAARQVARPSRASRPETRPEAQQAEPRPGTRAGGPAQPGRVQQPRRRVPPQFYSGEATPSSPGGAATRTTGQPIVPAPATRPARTARPARPARDPEAQPGQHAPIRPRRPTGTRPGPAPQPAAAGPPATPAAHARSRAAAQRMPFLLLVCGLLGGALVSALVISTTLDAGSFKITQLQQQDSQLDQQRQQLADQVASENSSPVISQRAYELGMRQQGVLRFLDLKAAQTETDANTAAAGYGAVNAINAPGYVP
ncbi:MAG TPA: hypothetical protein VHZ03_31505 [Trebonia sp.]|nr:hypothetical protein [Trebonia sp.]